MSRARLCMSEDNADYLTALRTKLSAQFLRLISQSRCNTNSLLVDEKALKCLQEKDTDPGDKVPIMYVDEFSSLLASWLQPIGLCVFVCQCVTPYLKIRASELLHLARSCFLKGLKKFRSKFSKIILVLSIMSLELHLRFL